jgi:hypothetical protein
METAMFTSDLRRLPILCLLLSFACQEPAPPVEADTVTTGTSTEPGTPTSAPQPPTTGPETPTTTSNDDGPSTTSTGEEVGTSSTGTDGTMGVPSCGDGVVDANEECDEGLGINDDSRFCTKNCMLNVCGDGKLFVGWELCDEGVANSDQYGSLCGAQCEPGPRCGDNKLQAEFETCDLGPGNGGPKGDEQGILCDASCRAMQLRGFVTEAAFTGALGGVFGADLKCRAAAKAAGLAEPERFSAYLSTGDVDAKTRFEKVATSWPYVLVTGTKFAENFALLIEHGPLGQGISVTEAGTPLTEMYVATNTAPGGVSFSPDQHCQGWTSMDGAYKGRVGFNALAVDSPDVQTWETEQWWTGIDYWHCDKSLFHLYCLEI